MIILHPERLPPAKRPMSRWRTQIALVADPERVMEVWYDNLDHDVSVSGEVQYQEWTWEPDDVTSQRKCLEEVGQLVDAFAGGLLPPPLRRRSS